MKTLEIISALVSVGMFVSFLNYGFVLFFLGSLTAYIVSVNAHDRSERLRLRNLGV